MSGGLIAAVQLEPGGLQLWHPIGSRAPMAWKGSGDSFHLHPLEMDPHSVSFKLIHFSGMGVSSGTASDRAARQKNRPCDE